MKIYNQDTEKIPKEFRALGEFFLTTLFSYITNRNRRRALKVERRDLPVLEDTIKTLKDGILSARRLGLRQTEEIHNIGLYLLLVSRDFAVLKVDMVSTFDEWRIKYTARQAALILYEVCQDLSHMLNNEFRTSLETMELSEEEMQRYKKLHSRFCTYKKTNHVFLNEIRNMVVAHRNKVAKNSLEFLTAIEQLDSHRIFELAGDFFKIVRELTDFLISITIRSGHPRFILRQLTAGGP